MVSANQRIMRNAWLLSISGSLMDEWEWNSAAAFIS
jgi:hypothetical protein